MTGCDADGFFVCFFYAAGSTETGCDVDGLTVLFIATDVACSTRTCCDADGLTVCDVCFFGLRRLIFLLDKDNCLSLTTKFYKLDQNLFF